MRSPAGTGGGALNAAGRPHFFPNIGHAGTPANQGAGVPNDARRAAGRTDRRAPSMKEIAMSDCRETAAAEAVRAWLFLKRNPDYIVERENAGGEPAPEESAPFPIRSQTEADGKATSWGLLAWEDPFDEAGPASPFWADVPMLEAAPEPGAPALTDLLAAPGLRLSGLRLGDGALILKAERGEAAVQMRIADGKAFDPAGGIALRLPVTLDLHRHLRRAADLWSVTEVDTEKDALAAA